MHSGVLYPAGVSIDGHPVIILNGVKWPFIVIRAQIPQMVPGRTHKSIHRIRLALSRLSTNRAGRIFPGWVQLQRALTRGQPFHILRQQHGQLIIRHRHCAMFGAVHNRDGRAPIALARNQPITQVVIDGAFPNFILLQPLNNFLVCFIAWSPTEFL